MQTKKIQTKAPSFDLDGRFEPKSINEETRTVEMVFTTSTPVRMFRFKGWSVEQFNEILSMEKDHVRLDRMMKGAPLLNSHNRNDLADQIGVVEKAWIDGEKLIGRVRFSKNKEVDAIWNNVKDGIIRNGSIGYRVHSYTDESENEEVQVKTLRAIDWEPMEMSLVTVPADHNAQVRTSSNETEHDCEIIIKNSNERIPEMKPVDTVALVSPTEADKIRKEEREKSQKIVRAVRQAKLPQTFAEEIIASNKSLEDCLIMVQEKWAESDAAKSISSATATRVDLGGGLDEVQTRREGAIEAILHRSFPMEHKLTEKGHKFHNRSAIEIARMVLEMNGTRTEHMSRNEICQRAFQSTSDFPAILEGIANKRLQAGYESVPQVFRKFAVETTLKDFKVSSVASLGEAPALEKVNEGGEIKTGVIGDTKEQYRLYTYGKKLAFTRETIINDDLGAMAKIAAAFGRAAAHLENTVAFKEAMLDNPDMADAVDLFHASHANLLTPAAFDAASLSAMKAMLRKQTDDKAQVMDLSARYLLVSAELEGAARTLLANQSTSGGFNVHGGSLELLVSAKLEAKDSYIIADPSQVEGLEYAYLEGARGLQIETKDHPDTLGVIVRAYLDFGAKVVNHRFAVFNTGA